VARIASYLVLLLIACGMSAASVAHAREPMTGQIGIDGYSIHAVAKSQGTNSSKKAISNSAGACHGHHIALAPASNPEVPIRRATILIENPRINPPVSTQPQSRLRPPIA
jgi:hypothetical protein